MNRKYNFVDQCQAFTTRGKPVTIPDEVCYRENYFILNKKSFPIIKTDGSRSRAILRPDLTNEYQLPVVEILSSIKSYRSSAPIVHPLQTPRNDV